MIFGSRDDPVEDPVTIDYELLTIYCVNATDLAIYDPDNKSAWIAARNPVNVRDWA